MFQTIISSFRRSMRSDEGGTLSFGNISQIHGKILQVDSEGDGNGVVTIEEWVWWKMKIQVT